MTNACDSMSCNLSYISFTNSKEPVPVYECSVETEAKKEIVAITTKIKMLQINLLIIRYLVAAGTFFTKSQSVKAHLKLIFRKKSLAFSTRKILACNKHRLTYFLNDLLG